MGVTTKTPERDRFADLMRTVALGAVILGHWTMAAVWWQDGELKVDNALNLQPWLWPLTWVFVLVPLFFLVGGFANYTSWTRTVSRGGGLREFARRRLVGLWVPVAPFLALVAIAVFAALQAGAPRGTTILVAVFVVMPLWFLLVYTVLALAVPFMLAAHRRWGVWVWLVMALGAIGFDALRTATDNSWAATANYFLVWALAQQIGFAYADGTLARWGKKVLALWAAGATALLVGAVTLGPWPASMIGLAGERSNFSPPAVPALLFMLAQIPLVLLSRDWFAKRLNRPAVAKVLDRASALAMPSFLWHLPVLVLVTGVVLVAGIPLPEPATATWWLTKPLFIFAYVVGLYGVLSGLNDVRKKRALRAELAAAGRAETTAAEPLPQPELTKSPAQNQSSDQH